MEKLWIFELFSGDKGDNMICGDQNTIKANQSHMNVLLISEVDNIENTCLSLKSDFFLYFTGI